MKRSILGLSWLFALALGVAPKASASFYESFLQYAIADCPGFIGGTAQMYIDTPFSSFGEARFRYRSFCYEPMMSTKMALKPMTEFKTNGPDDNPHGPDDEDPGDCHCKGSEINPLDGSVGERIPIAGAPFDLVYFSSRVEGKVGRRIVKIPLSDTNMNVTAYRISGTYADGRTFDQSFLNLASHVYTFTWDGLDSFGQPVHGSAPLEFTVTITAHGKNIPVHYTNILGGVLADVFGFGHWTPSIYHAYDTLRGELIRGDGTVEKIGARVLDGGDLMVAEKDGSFVYIFDYAGRHLYTKYGLTGANRYVFAHDGNGLLTSITEPYSRVTTFTSSSGRITQITAPNGSVTNLSYGSPGNALVKVQGPMGNTYQMSYYDGGLISRFTVPGGQTSSFYYDEAGKLTKDFHSSGFFQDLTSYFDSATKLPVAELTSRGGRTEKWFLQNIYQFGGQMVTTQIHSSGYQVYSRTVPTASVTKYSSHSIETSYAPDPRFPESAVLESNRSKSVEGKSRTTRSKYSFELDDPADPFSLNQMTLTEETHGDVQISVYDAAEKIWTQTSAENRVSSTKLNENLQAVEWRAGLLAPVRFSYNSIGKIASVSQGKRKSEFGYDGLGYLSSITDALGRSTRFENDPLGRVTKQVLPDGRVIALDYDANGNLIGVTPPGRPKHGFLLNAFEAVKEYLPPSIGGETKTVYQYDIDHRLNKILRPNGQTATFTYDSSSGLLQNIDVQTDSFWYAYDNVHDNWNFTYTASGVQSQFDYFGTDLKSEIQTLDYADPISIESVFDDRLRISASIVKGATTRSVVTRDYSKDGLLRRNGWAQYKRSHPLGRVTELKIDNVVAKFSYDPEFGELSGIEYRFKDRLLFQRTYTRDSLGRIFSEKVGSSVNQFDYDVAGRFVGKRPYGESDWISKLTYDPNGNIRTAILPGTGEVEASYDDQDRILTWSPDVVFLHDGDGNRTERNFSSGSNVTTYSYNALNILTSVTDSSFGTVAYKLDAYGRRVVRTVNDVRTTRYLWENDLRLAAEFDDSNEIYKRFVYGDSVNVPDYMEYGGARYVLVKDIRGTPWMVVNSKTGDIVQSVDYDDLGRVLTDSAPGLQPFGYAGGLYDQNTKFVRFGTRDYDPETGRFTSKDPILFDGGDTNLYGYVMADPVNFVDPDGESAIALPIGGIGGIGGAIGGIGVGGAFIGGWYLGSWINDNFIDPYFWNQNNSDDGGQCGPRGGHTSNQRPSNLPKHEEGESRRRRDQGGEKGDDVRRPGRQRPPGYRGPWPPR